MARDANWQKFEDLICKKLKEIDPNIRATKGSGNSTEKHDIKTNCGLACECKDYNKISVYNEEWMQKVISEVPLHSDKLPVLFTRNKEGKIRAHLDGDDFARLYIEYWKMKNG
jgi:hypothetical protein